MAARENQGLQIALIIFVIITIALSVSTFMFFSKYDEERNKIAEKVKAAETANNRAADAEGDVKTLKGFIGAAAGDPVKTIEENKTKDFEGSGLADNQQNYRQLIKQLQKTLAEKQTDLIAAQERENKLNDKIKVDEKTKVGEIVKYTETVDTTGKDLLGVRDDATKAQTAQTGREAELKAKLDAKIKEYDSQVAKFKASNEDLEGQVAKLGKRIEQLLEEKHDEEQAAELLDGAIAHVDQSTNLVWVNLGSEDGLRQQVTFQVISKDDTNLKTAKPKASVEVIRVSGPHMSEARIVDNNPTDPIVPGDKIYSTAWQPGRIEHFALMGFMDLNGDGLSDRDIVKRLIAVNGGVVDAELTDDGELTGEIKVGTKYLLEGSSPSDKALSDKMVKNISKITNQAVSLNVQKMGVEKFLDSIGYRPDQRTVALGRKARPDDFKPRQPDVIKKSIGKTIDYNKIRPKPPQTPY